jgi:hypothetical protein
MPTASLTKLKKDEKNASKSGAKVKKRGKGRRSGVAPNL